MSYLERFLKRVRGGELPSVLSVPSLRYVESEEDTHSKKYREIDSNAFHSLLDPPPHTYLEGVTDKTAKSQDGCGECGRLNAAAYVEIAGGSVDSTPLLLCSSCYVQTLRDVAREAARLAALAAGQP